MFISSSSFPFRGKAGMGASTRTNLAIACSAESPHPNLPPEGEGVIQKDLDA